MAENWMTEMPENWEITDNTLIQPGLYTHKEMPHAIHAGTL